MKGSKITALALAGVLLLVTVTFSGCTEDEADTDREKVLGD
ncbi:MAG: hypothetical protein ACQEQM_03160 [Thermoplasmatota archaeon]